MPRAMDTLFQQALELPDDERGELAARLLGTLDPAGEDVVGDEWEAAWSGESDRRVADVRDGRGSLLDGPEVLAEVRAITERS